MRFRIALLGLAATLASTGTARAQGTADFKFLNGGTITNSQQAGPYAPGTVYVGPYNGEETIGGVTNKLFLYCVDFAHDIHPNDVWNANLTSLGDGNSLTGTRHGAETDALVKYREAAWLSTQFSLFPSATEAIQDAMWNVFLAPSSQIPYGATWLANAQTAASSNFNGMDFTYFQVVTDNTPTPATGERQEFLIYSTPEPASLVLLATGLLGVAGVAQRRKRAAG